MNAVRHFLYGFCIEVHIGNGCEESGQHQLIRSFFRASVCLNGAGQSDERSCQLILKLRDICRFSADACLACAAFAHSGLFALETKHFVHVDLTQIRKTERLSVEFSARFDILHIDRDMIHSRNIHGSLRSFF